MSPRKLSPETFRRGAVNVYVVDADRLDSQAIEEKVKSLYPGEDVVIHSLVANKLNLNHVIQHVAEFKRQLLDFDPETDRLIVVGRSLANFLVGWLLGTLGNKRVTILIYTFETESYDEMEIDVTAMRVSRGGY